jgi:hypothetical protein
MGLAFSETVPADRFVEVEGGLLDTRPVLPGQEALTIFYSYHLGVAGQTVRLERSYDYPIAVLNVLLAQPGLTLRSDQLQDSGPQLFEDRQYALYTAAELPAGTPLVIDLTVQVPSTASPAVPQAPGKPIQDSQGLLRWLAFGLAGLAILGAVLYPLVTSQPQAGRCLATPTAAAPTLTARSAPPQVRRLLAELADLEAAFEAGQIDEETYLRQRAEKREAIRSLWP